jgi:hypothetical protein
LSHELYTDRMKRRMWKKQPAVQARLVHLGRKRKLAMTRQMPAWADLDAIEAIYREAAERTLATGIEHHVDHWFPLQGATVCGLHVAANLRVMTGSENVRKWNKMPNDPEAVQVENDSPRPPPTPRRTSPQDLYRQWFPNSIVRAQRKKR